MTVSEKHIKAAKGIMDDACLPMRFYENGVVRTMQKAISAALSAAEREGREDERKRCAEIARTHADFVPGLPIHDENNIRCREGDDIATAILSQAGEV